MGVVSGLILVVLTRWSSGDLRFLLIVQLELMWVYYKFNVNDNSKCM